MGFYLWSMTWCPRQSLARPRTMNTGQAGPGKRQVHLLFFLYFHDRDCDTAERFSALQLSEVNDP